MVISPFVITKKFWVACKDGDTEEALKIIAKEEFSINAELDGSFCDINHDKTTYLNIAMEWKRSEIVRRLLEDPSLKLDAAYDYSKTALFLACDKNSEECVQLFLNNERCSPSIVNMQDNKNQTALLLAIKNSDPAIVRILLDYPGIDVNLKDKKGMTPLHEAIERESPEIVEMVLANPTTKMDVTNRDGMTVVFYACWKCNLDVLKLLVNDKRMETSILNEPYGGLDNFESFLHMLARGGEHEMIPKVLQLMLDQPNINVNSKDHLGRTPLMDAVGRDDKMAKMILENPATELDVVAEDGNTVFTLACERNSVECLKMFLQDKRWDPKMLEQKTAKGDSGLIIAAYQGSLEIVKLILDQPNIDVNIQDSNGESPLNFAMKCNFPEIVEILLAREETKLDILDENIEYSLLLACKNNHVECVKLFLADKRCNAEIVNNVGKNDLTTALTIAAKSGNTEIVKMLLDYPGVDVNLKQPILFAMEHGHFEIAKILLEKENIEPDVKNDHGETGLILASQKNHVKCVENILDHEKCRSSAYINYVYTDFLSNRSYCALSAAATNDHSEIVKILLKQPNIDVGKANEMKNLLIYAMSANQPEIVKMLLSNKDVKLDDIILSKTIGKEYVECARLFLESERCTADMVNKVSRYGSALNEAVFLGNPVMVRMILDFPGADPNITDERGRTPLMRALNPKDAFDRNATNRDTTIVKLLLDKENTRLDVVDNFDRPALSLANYAAGIKLFTADPRCTPELLNFKNEYGNTYLSSAVINERTEIIKILVNHPDMDCNTGNPLAYTIENDMPDILALLLTNQTVKFTIGTSLINACLENYCECVKLVTSDSRCTPEILNAKNEIGETALMTAVAYRNTDVVEYLANLSDIDFTLRSNCGKTAMDIALEKFDKTSAKILESVQG